MNIRYFHNLSQQQAASELMGFLKNGNQASHELLERHFPHCADSHYQPASVPMFWEWIAQRMQTLERSEQDNAPRWLRNSEVYRRHRFDLSDSSIGIVFAAAYYLGESFCRTYPMLQWGIGHPDTMSMNMPVVSGFTKSDELAVTLIAEGQLRGMITGECSVATVNRLVQFWINKVPQ